MIILVLQLPVVKYPFMGDGGIVGDIVGEIVGLSVDGDRVLGDLVGPTYNK